jgi:hypothetical protein
MQEHILRHQGTTKCSNQQKHYIPPHTVASPTPAIEQQTWVEPRSHCINVNGYEENSAQYMIAHLKPVHQEVCKNIFKYVT